MRDQDLRTVRTLTIRAGRTFSAIPKSNSHTSPRAGVILFGVQPRKELIGSVRGFRIVQWPGIEWNGPSQKRGCKNLFLLFWKSLECNEKLRCLPAHIS